MVFTGVALVTLASLFLFVGCERKDYSDIKATSSLTKQQWLPYVYTWTLGDSEKRSFSYVAGTGSMAPAMSENSILLIERVDVSEITPGDVVIRKADWSDTGTVVHRVVWTNGKEFTTEGDSVGREDHGIATKDDLLWRVAAILYMKP